MTHNMKYDIRLYESKDYELLRGMWDSWKRNVHKNSFPMEEFLPKTGVIVELEGDVLAFGFLYKTDSAFCLFEWISVNKAASREDRDKALDLLTETISKIARDEGFGVLFNTCVSDHLVKRLEKHDFVVCDTGMTNLLRSL